MIPLRETAMSLLQEKTISLRETRGSPDSSPRDREVSSARKNYLLEEDGAELAQTGLQRCPRALEPRGSRGVRMPERRRENVVADPPTGSVSSARVVDSARRRPRTPSSR